MHHDPDTLRRACEHLAETDPALARAYDAISVPVWRTAPPEYESIARTVTFQLLSTRAAGAIWERVLAWGGGKLHCETVINGDDDALRACGLSRPKVQHLKSIALAISTGALDLKSLETLPDHEARKALIAVKGIGPWTAEIYLLSALGRMDAFPEGDVGLMEAFRMLREDDERFAPKAFLQHAETWRPYRAVAAQLLWGYINMTREKDY